MLNATVGQGEVKKAKANVADSMSCKDLPFPVTDVTVVSMPLGVVKDAPALSTPRNRRLPGGIIHRVPDRVGLDLLHEARDSFLAVHDGLAVVHVSQREQLDLVMGTVSA